MTTSSSPATGASRRQAARADRGADRLSRAHERGAKRAYVIADNRLAEKAGWDEEILAIEFQTLFELAPELDLTVTGFESPRSTSSSKRTRRARDGRPR